MCTVFGYAPSKYSRHIYTLPWLPYPGISSQLSRPFQHPLLRSDLDLSRITLALLRPAQTSTQCLSAFPTQLLSSQEAPTLEL